jgi:hypothetical protein
MPRQSLIEELEALLNLYSQRRRATDALLRTLKGANDALTKADRALADYAGQNTLLDQSRIDQTQQALADIQFKERVYDAVQLDLRRETKALANQVKAIRDAIAALQGDMVDLIKLDRAYQSLLESPLQGDEQAAVLPELAEEVEEAQTRLGSEFGAALRDALADLGIRVGGRPPRFEVGRFEINANFVNRTASISYGKTMLVPRVKLSLDTLIKTYQNQVSAVEERGEDGKQWIQQFYAAWENARRKTNKNTSRVNIVDCYYELVLLRQKRTFNSAPSKRSFVDYDRAQFAYDFYEFTHRQRLAHEGLFVKGHTATKSQADSPSRSMWIVEGSNPHDGRYVSDVAFVTNPDE